ncbi:MAG: 4'-phosphopantetheinyl transferase superfamily protein [Gloeomargaritaceae cyanobacterium C42_A2020_066]|nr:4'-phosphopantetheinyl transferase superfamily protein [Gloeomargaritaceae cyanobacterium C42_A2020_066]
MCALKSVTIAPLGGLTLVQLRVPTPAGGRVDRSEVTVWWGDLTTPAGRPVDFLQVLSEAEQLRAMAYRHPLRQRAFVLGRLGLRQLVGAALGLRPAEVQIQVNTQGKPYLPTASLHLSLAHSGDRVIYALAGRPVGIDLERARTYTHVPAIARRYFHPVERVFLADSGWQPQVFAHLWTAKEAYAKAVGFGLGSYLQQVNTLARSSRPNAQGWAWATWEPEADYTASLCWRPAGVVL